MSLVLGQVVSSKAGRDRNRKYLVVALESDDFVLVADGFRRKIANPKRKNIKHLVAHAHVVDEIHQALSQGTKVTNQQLRYHLERLSERSDQGREEGSSDNG